MRISHYCFFAIYTTTLSGAEIEKRVGLTADRIMVKGSKQADPPRPAFHSWEIHSGRDNPSLSQQIEQVMSRLVPYAESLAALLPDPDREEGCGCSLQIIRRYDGGEGWETEAEHVTLGFGLEEAHVQLLAQLDASIDVDEYDD